MEKHGHLNHKKCRETKTSIQLETENTSGHNYSPPGHWLASVIIHIFNIGSWAQPIADLLYLLGKSISFTYFFLFANFLLAS